MPVDTAPTAKSSVRIGLLRSRITQFALEPRTAAEAVAVLYMALIAISANRLHLFYILFPELGALAVDVLTRPWGQWAKQPWKLVITPTATAVIGIAVSRHLSYGITGILLILFGSIAVILALRSAVAPAISAGVLPLVLGVRSWLYPPSICFGLAVLPEYCCSGDGSLLHGSCGSSAERISAPLNCLRAVPESITGSYSCSCLQRLSPL